jgi:predicted nucleic acid-binding Zn ribbon protein
MDTYLLEKTRKKRRKETIQPFLFGYTLMVSVALPPFQNI